MDKALHPQLDQLISVSQYLAVIKASGQVKSPLEDARCPCCKSAMGVRNYSTKNRSACFYHKKQDTGCPTIDPNQSPYEQLPEPRFHPACFEAGKRYIRLHWVAIYYRFKQIVPATTLDEFIATLEVAKNRRLLKYADLNWKMMPYYLVALGNFTTRTGITAGQYKRKYNFRFYFAQEAFQNPGAWVSKRHLPPLFRMSYKDGTIFKIESPIVLSSVDEAITAKEGLRKHEIEQLSQVDKQISELFAPFQKTARSV
jgi:hypothetical protein